MTGISISPNNDWHDYGPNVVDRWKARAFAQDPSSKTPCCGFEEEDTHWGGSSTLLGERVGPVRAIRETWGADSGTNVIRRETFYRDQVRQKTWLRVHVIPPLDGIYAQWDFAAGRMTRFYNPNAAERRPGRRQERHRVRQPRRPLQRELQRHQRGHWHPRCAPQRCRPGPTPTRPTASSTRALASAQGAVSRGRASTPTTRASTSTTRRSGRPTPRCSGTRSTGPVGTIVDRYQVDQATDLTPGGAAQSLVAVPYYRDDSCFDDGTGSDPGPSPRLVPARPTSRARSPGRAPTGTSLPRAGAGRRPTGDRGRAHDRNYYQGDIGTHGLHLLFQLDSDNARQTVPVDEIVSEKRMVMLPGQQGNVGEQYGREFEKPLVAPPPAPSPRPGGAGGPATPPTHPPPPKGKGTGGRQAPRPAGPRLARSRPPRAPSSKTTPKLRLIALTPPPLLPPLFLPVRQRGAGTCRRCDGAHRGGHEQRAEDRQPARLPGLRPQPTGVRLPWARPSRAEAPRPPQALAVAKRDKVGTV